MNELNSKFFDEIYDLLVSAKEITDGIPAQGRLAPTLASKAIEECLNRIMPYTSATEAPISAFERTIPG